MARSLSNFWEAADGIGTINGETPLYVIDGIPVQAGGENDQGYSFLNNLNPNDLIDIYTDSIHLQTILYSHSVTSCSFIEHNQE